MIRNMGTDRGLGMIDFDLPSDSMWAKAGERSVKVESEGDQRAEAAVLPEYGDPRG